MCRSSNEPLCSSTSGLSRPLSRKHHRKHRLHLILLIKRRRTLQLKEGRDERKKKKVVVKVKSEIEMKNLKLYMENQSIIEENERLRKKALLLHEENQALLSQLQNKLSSSQPPKLIN